MSETSVEDQAALAIVFEENIRELVRKHLKAALEDPMFMGQLGGFQLGETIVRSGVLSSVVFRDAVKSVIVQQMQKY